GAILVTRLYSRLIRNTGEGWAPGATALAMIGIGGGIGLTTIFEAIQLS
ncbi:acetyl-CoA C-acyltransferase, partial [Rhizobium johnstonii]